MLEECWDGGDNVPTEDLPQTLRSIKLFRGGSGAVSCAAGLEDH